MHNFKFSTAEFKTLWGGAVPSPDPIAAPELCPEVGKFEVHPGEQQAHYAIVRPHNAGQCTA